MQGNEPGEKDEERRESEEGWEDWCGWWRQDNVDSVGWGVFFIWAALILLAGITGYSAQFPWWNGWAVLFIGGGVITLAEMVYRLCAPRYRHKWVAGLIWGLCLLAIGGGLGDWPIWQSLWVVVLAAVGVAILAGVFVRPR